MELSVVTPGILRKRRESLDRGMTAKGLGASALASLLEPSATEADLLAAQIAEARIDDERFDLRDERFDLLKNEKFCERVATFLGMSPPDFALVDAPKLPVPPPERTPRKLSGPRRKNVQDPPPTSPASHGDRKELACTPEEIAVLFADAVVIAFQAVNRDGTKEYFLRAERQIGEGELLSLLLRKP